MAICTPDLPLYPFARIMRQSSKQSPCICLVSFTNHGDCGLLIAADQAAVGISLPFLLPWSAPALRFISISYKIPRHEPMGAPLVSFLPSRHTADFTALSNCVYAFRETEFNCVFLYFPPRLDSRNRTFFLTEFPDTISMGPHQVPPDPFQIFTHRQGHI